jgi:hypothetical protein
LLDIPQVIRAERGRACGRRRRCGTPPPSQSRSASCPGHPAALRSSVVSPSHASRAAVMLPPGLLPTPCRHRLDIIRFDENIAQRIVDHTATAQVRHFL